MPNLANSSQQTTTGRSEREQATESVLRQHFRLGLKPIWEQYVGSAQLVPKIAFQAVYCVDFFTDRQFSFKVDMRSGTVCSQQSKRATLRYDKQPYKFMMGLISDAGLRNWRCPLNIGSRLEAMKTHVEKKKTIICLLLCGEQTLRMEWARNRNWIRSTTPSSREIQNTVHAAFPQPATKPRSRKLSK